MSDTPKTNCFSSIVSSSSGSSNNNNNNMKNYSQVIKSKLQQTFFLSRPSGKKIVFGLLFVIVLLYYVVPLMWTGGHRYIVLSRIERCLEDKLRPYTSKADSKNAFIYHSPAIKDQKEKYFLPYIGNGYIGISLDGNHGVWLKGARGLDIATDYNPVVHFAIKGYDIREAMVLDIVDGKIVKHSCFQQHDSTWYIHRTRPGLLVQQVSFYNPTDDNIEVSVSQGSLSSWATDYKSIDNIKDDSQSDADTATTWQVGSKMLVNQVLLTVASRQFSQTGILELPAKRSVSRHSLTVFDYTLAQGNDDKLDTKQTILDRKAHTVKAVQSVLGTGDDHLREQHKTAWHELWQSGFAISDSKAVNSLNSDVINSTLYYILSHVSSPLQEVTSNLSEKQLAVSYLNNPEGCYHYKHHTLQFSSLWEIGDKVQTMNKGVDTHLSSLDHYGCSSYIKAGAAGILQAVLLSLGGFSFKTSDNKVLHMEFNADPADLHRDYQFTNIRYADRTLLNISVIVDASNFAVLHVSSSADNFYACDAALTQAVPLSTKVVTLPVKLTKPLTAILYISNDKDHLMHLKKVVHHVEEPVIAPAQDHRVLARHKHGHSYGGLPVIFWIILALLIIVFHFFLFKMVFSELCRADNGSYYRRRAFS